MTKARPASGEPLLLMMMMKMMMMMTAAGSEDVNHLHLLHLHLKLSDHVDVQIVNACGG
jgi:hypothetical protein